MQLIQTNPDFGWLENNRMMKLYSANAPYGYTSNDEEVMKQSQSIDQENYP
jgi:hypothetical protein